MPEQQASVLQDPGGTLGHAATFAQGPKASGVQVQAEHTRSLSAGDLALSMHGSVQHRLVHSRPLTNKC